MATEKTNRVISVTLNHSIRQIQIDVAGQPSLTFHADRTSDTVKLYAQMLGFKNRIVDAAAKSVDPATGKPASASEKRAAMAAIIEHLESGTSEWGLRTVRASASDDTLLIAALMEVMGQSDRAKVAASVKTWEPAKRAAVRMREDVKAVLDRMTAEAAADVDTDALLEELM